VGYTGHHPVLPITDFATCSTFLPSCQVPDVHCMSIWFPTCSHFLADNVEESLTSLTPLLMLSLTVRVSMIRSSPGDDLVDWNSDMSVLP